MLSIKAGGFKIVDSGLVHLLSEEENEIKLDDVILKILFIEDKGKARVKIEKSGTKTLIITFYNFTSPLGHGSTSLIEIGRRKSKKLFFAFKVFSLNDISIRTLEYTFYVK